MLESYLPIFAMISFAVATGIILSVLGIVIGPKRKTAQKLTTYESGIEPVGTVKQRISVKYYLVAMLFIVFDIEVVFMYPWATSFRELGLAGFIPMLTFALLLLAGYFYIIRKGALEWD
ncbi:MAG: NADH-quinone oxidoreductase subunit A [Candidatus Thermochlorobacter aerophilum]|jgi:NADH-quinone oxidoreductase subunit A|uniref:NADH-quinone oxidoreductase subunit A n=1 Tax=Candidatus Thermochlorobacter aerophilus TaxID=1868324 RepID=A0A395M0G1_9BACT|nr:MAG: NADH-quinone oxidoreductase subunit A [Candidatus Thermochlorobacter aerophilum]